MPGDTDPTVVRSVAVHADDVVAAAEANRRPGREAVLRITPPFSGRMRARLHARDVVPEAEAAAEADPERDGPEPIEIEPRSLLAEDVPAYPHPDETEDEIRSDPDAEYTRERHREEHERAVEAWRERARAGILDAATVETSEGPLEVEVAVLGG